MFAAVKQGPEQRPDGVIDSGGLAVVDVRGLHYPLTAALASASTSRNIQLSIDGADWFDAPLDAVTDVGIVLAILSPVRFVRFAGAPGDEWGIT